MARLHLITIFTSTPAAKYSHCAFQGRCTRFGKMMLPFGHEVIEYSNAGTEAQSSEHVEILDAETFERLKALYKEEQPHEAASTDSSLYREFCKRLVPELSMRVRDGDIICHPFGIAHADLGHRFPNAHHVEIGIGYTQCAFPLRVYETYHWLSWHHGKEQTDGNAFEWVCPMGHDIDQWEPNYETGEYLLFFGRVNECKGLYTVKEIARHSNMKVIICGEGDPEPFLDPEITNLEYLPPVTGKARSELLGGAYAMLCPTKYIEPLCNSGIEAQLCGTPILCSDYGAFHEIMQHGYSGFRCHTLGDYLEAIKMVPNLNRRAIASTTRSKYSFENVGRQMDKIFKQIETLNGRGWYSLEATDAVWKDL
jgi:glycosyltransferase involved in cell wall biosynthesis